MKKYMFFYLALLFWPSLSNLCAQDTIWSRPRSNYIYDCFVDEKYSVICNTAPHVGGWGSGAIAKRVIIEQDTVKVVGVAAALATRMDICSDGQPPVWEEDVNEEWYRDFHENTYDPSYNNCYEHLCIYAHEGDSLRVIDSVRVHRLLDTASHIVRPIGYNIGWGDIQRENCFYLYEKYFDSALTLTDSFYVGMTQYTFAKYYDIAGDFWEYRTIPFMLLHLLYRDNSAPRPEVKAHQTLHWRDSTRTWRFYYNGSSLHQKGFYFIFPILETEVGEEVSIETLEQLTEVFPNPASGQVTVASSFGLQGVSVYNAAGIQVLEQHGLAGTMHSIDISALPPGHYILHLRTPAGTATKKLVVR